MKLKALLLVAFAVAGVGASIAVADNGRGNGDGHGDHHGCRATEISGTVAPQTFTVTVTHAERHGSVPPGSTVVVTIGGAGQTVRANVNACASPGGTGTTATSTTPTTVRSVDLRAFPTRSATTTTATTTTTG